jgi:prolipoprotein diacylglyceryltransferase
MKSAKIQPTYRVGDCSAEYPVPRKPMSLLEMAGNTLALTFIAWLLFYVVCKWLGVL